MSKKHDEDKDIRLVSHIAKIDYSNKTIQSPKSAIIGNTTWGRIDFLTHYCGWTFLWNDDIRVSGRNFSDNDDTKNRKREAKKLAKEASLSNKTKKRK